MAEKPTYTIEDIDAPVSKLANALSANSLEFSAEFKMSRWDVCCAYANAIGHILADAAEPLPDHMLPPEKRGRKGGGIPKEAAFARMRDLIKVMENAYELRSTKGEA